MTPSEPCLPVFLPCVVSSHLPLGWVCNNFNQLSMIETMLCLLWNHLWLAQRFLLPPSLTASLEPNMEVDSVPHPVAFTEFQMSSDDSNLPCAPGYTTGNFPDNLHNYRRRNCCFWASGFWGGLSCCNRLWKYQGSLISAAQGCCALYSPH